MGKKTKSAIWWLPMIAMLIFDVVVITNLVQNGAIARLWAQAPVDPSVVLPAPITDDLPPFEYCVLQENSGPANQILAGTPIPMEPVPLGSTPTQITATLAPVLPTESVATETPQTFEPTATFEPSATQPVYNEFDSWQIAVTDMGVFKESNFHIVVIGVGYADGVQNEAGLREIISGLEVNFARVRIDFAFVQSPLNLNLEHADQSVDFSNPKDLESLLAKIRKVHPVDGVAVAIDTPLFLGTSDAKYFAMLTGSDPNSLTIASHEISHLLGLGDGYRAYYPDGYLPNGELFYLDGMPRILSDALPKLGSIPPMYEVGTCNGRKLYTFYERAGNIMSDYNPQGPNSWGDSLFTPLQIEVMNNFIATRKGGD
jgi:hypothetical protein